MCPPRPVLPQNVTTDTAVLSDELKKFLDEGKVYATVATVGATGHPHLTVVWIKREGEDLLFSTTVDRQQGKNLARDPRITVMVNPPERPEVYAAIRGTATIIPDPDRALPDELSLAYTGKTYADYNPDAVNDGDRITIRVTPHRITGGL